MTSLTRTGLQELHDISTEYSGILSSMESLTDKLIAAVETSSWDQMESLLKERTGLCGKFGPALSRVKDMVRQIDDLSGNMSFSETTAVACLRAATDKLDERHKSLLDKQSYCEKLVAEKLHECKTQLTALDQNTRLKSMYSYDNRTQPSRYLDSRL